MPTMQSKLVSRTIWLEKKKIWKINIQKNGIRKSFYSSTPGDKGRKICAQNAASWLSGSCPFAVSDHTTVETVFERYLKDKELETTNIYTIRNRYNNHIKPIIGKIPVMLLTKQDLKRVIYTAYRKCDLSQKSLKNIRGDETSMILDTTGRDKEGKAAISVITNKLLAIGRLGRALGIHLLVATQRPDVGSVPGSLKAQLDGRICGHTADAQSSIVILDDGSAANLPAIPGRFIIRNGSETDDIVQAYYYHK